MIKKILFFLLLIIAICSKLYTTPLFAADFFSHYKTTYEFDETGKAHISSEISLVNQKSDSYVSEYSLTVTGSKIEEVEAYDKIGPIVPVISRENEITKIKLTFNDKAVGKGKILNFILKYKSNDFSEKSGNLWQISLPKLFKFDENDTYDLIIKVPKSFGKINYIEPQYKTKEESDKFIQISFDKSKLSTKGILAIFGFYQTLDFRLLYKLKNENPYSIKEKITLPPDTNYQQVFYKSIFPLPENIETDSDGNWIATYEIQKNQNLDIEAKGKVNIFSKTRSDFKLRQEISNDYISSQEYWDTNNQEIETLALDLKTPEKIFDYVVRKLSYNYDLLDEKITRKGAVWALKNPSQSLCTEFTDLFIALCRAAGIPARELEGYAFDDKAVSQKRRSEVDILHSWPEYFDQNSKNWISVDPTFAKTSGGDFFHQFDMTHFVFVIHGKNDDLPPPAGSFKEEISQKQIFIDFGEDVSFNKIPEYKISFYNPRSLSAFISNKSRVMVKNASGFAMYDQKFSLSTLGKVSPNSWQIPVFLPFSYVNFNYTIKPNELFKDYLMQTIISSEDLTLPFQQKVKSMFIRVFIALSVIISFVIVRILISLKKERGKNAKIN